MIKSVFATNLTYLHISAQQLLQGFYKNYANFKSTCQPTKDGNYTITYQNRFLHSRFQPQKEANNKLNEQLKQQNLQLVNYIFFLGADLLYQVDALVRLPLADNCKLFLVYPSFEVMMSCFITRDLKSLQAFKGDVYVIAPPVSNEVSEHPLARLNLNISDLRGSLFIDNLKAYHNHPFLKKVYEALRETITDWFASNLTQLFFEKKWLLNAVNNSFFLQKAYAFSELATYLRNGNYADRCLLISAGPSLYGNIDLIKEKQQQGWVLVASDTALSPMLASDITPDFVISVDGGYYNSHDFNVLPSTANEDCTLIADITVYPNIVRNFKGKIFFFALNALTDNNESFDHLDHLDYLGNSGKFFLNALGLQEKFTSPLYSSGSVANLMLNICEQMAFTKIGLIGLDFSYPFACSHCESTTHKLYYLARSHRLNPATNEEYFYIRNRLQQKEANQTAGENYTERFFLQCKNNFENEIQILKKNNPSLCVENNTTYGLKLQGASYPFKEILIQSANDKHDIRVAMQQKFFSNLNVVLTKQKLKVAVRNLNEELIQLQALSASILASIEKKEIDKLQEREDHLKQQLKNHAYLYRSMHFLSLSQHRYHFPNPYLKKYAWYKEQHKIFTILIRKNLQLLADC